jgi:hypothetical protein
MNALILPTSPSGALAVLASLLSIVGFIAIMSLASRLRQSLKAIHLGLQLLHIPVSRKSKRDSYVVTKQADCCQERC